MADLTYPVITIGREYCAYGRTIAKALSEKLGIPYYDQDFVRKTVEESGYSADEINAEGEQMTNLSLFLDNMLGATAAYTSPFDKIYEAQKNVILDLAKNPCIIIGRCSDHILKEHNIPSFHIFLFADPEFRLPRAAELNPGKSEEQLRKLMKKTDDLRATYYKHYTGEDIHDYNNYDICLDVGKMGVDKCVKILTEILTK